jgi:peptide/nickel transport system substrate-binding protein
MRRLPAFFALIAAVVLIGACGSDDNDNGSNGSNGGGSGGNGQQGGTLTMLTSGDVDDNLDPGYSYYQLDFIYDYAMHRPVLSYKPNDTTKASPDLAKEYPTVSKDGKTVTIKLRRGVRFSPPVNREVTAADVKYAIERDFLPQVGNGYATAYWGDLLGSKQYGSGDAKEISGLEMPDKYTLVMRLSRPTGTVAAQALALPGSAPVPKEYAAKYDQGKVSSYGKHVVATGPYMVPNDKSGKITGYQPGHRITFVRNPNWDKSTDYRPAYLDKFVYDEGNDATIGNRKILTSQNSVGNPTDLSPPPAFLKANLNNKDNLIPGPFSGRVRYVALNTKIKPFDDENVRKAVAAGLDRNAMNIAFGGKAVGEIATHIITPGITGFEEAGGDAGPNLDFLRKPEGDPQLAASYLKKAGFKSGKYSGPKLLMIAESSANQKAAAQVALASMQKLGFDISFRPVTRSTMYSKFCGVPSSKTPICPSVGWLKDFADPQTMLGPTFKGSNIVQTNNSNWPQLDVPAIDRAMDKAEVLVDPEERAKAWAKIDDMVTATAGAIPWQWDKTALVKSTNVNAVINKANAAWDMSFTSVGAD